MSASLGYQYDSWNDLNYINEMRQVAETMLFLYSLITISNNTLSMMVSYDVFENDTASWRPLMTERDDFWEPSKTGETRALVLLVAVLDISNGMN